MIRVVAARAVVVLAVALVPIGARAQDAPETDASVELFERGVELLRTGDHRAAAAAFRESYRIAPRVTTMCNLALTYDRWGPEHRAQAVRAYRACARDDESGRFRAFAERRVGEIERELVLLEVEGEGDDEGDGGDETGATDEARSDPSPPPPPAPPTPTPATRAEPDHALLFVGLGAGGLAIASAIAGIVLALDAQSTLDALRAELGTSPILVRGSPQHDRLERARDAASAATGLYVAAGVLAAGAATLVVVDLVTTSASDVAVTLAPTPSGVMLTVRF